MSNKKPLALYVHWPFCKAKCPYCDFNSHVREGVDHARWRAAMVAELRYIAGVIGDRHVTSVFFGGGTPSLMEAQTVEAVLGEADKIWGLDAGCEITLEANPTSVEAAKFKDFKAAGVNRVSIGVQALNDADLRALGRQHSADEGRRAVELGAQVFDRFSFDLIYARPHQTVKDWERELSDALGMVGEHLSVYQLTIEPGTQFHTLYNSGRLLLPSEDVAADFYEVTQTLCEGAGLYNYEVSNHAKKGCESRHNLTYWTYGEYAGIGPGAHGRVDVPQAGEVLQAMDDVAGGSPVLPVLPVCPVRMATRTHRAPEIWLDRVEKTGHGYHEFEAVDAREAFEERLMMGLRLAQGVALADLQAEWLDMRKIRALMQEGLLEQSTTHLVPTHAGRLVLTSLNGAIII